MKVQSMLCNNCGAPIESSIKARFVTCGFCGVQLKIERQGGGIWTEVIGELDERTRKMARDLQSLKMQTRLAALDRRWEAQRKELVIRDKNGAERIPSQGLAMVALVMGFFAAGAALIMTREFAFSGLFPFFPVIFAGGGVLGFLFVRARAERYQAARRHYLRERRTIMRSIQDMEQAEPPAPPTTEGDMGREPA